MSTPFYHQHCLRHLFSLINFCLLLTLLVACGDMPPAQPTVVAPATEPAAAALPAGCDDFLPFCNTVTIRGAVTTEGSIGSTHRADSCAAWADGASAPRILELPFIVGAGESKITVALTRIGAYNGPGTYQLAAQTMSGMPDMFPTIEVAGRTFSNGEGAAATVTVAADGSGHIEATGLVEIASIQVANPDPTARIDFAMTWLCKD